jgi:hypothetical protein
MGKAHLKRGLQKRGLSTKGSKDDLVKRLDEASDDAGDDEEETATRRAEREFEAAQIRKENAEREKARAHLEKAKKSLGRAKAPKLREELAKRGLDARYEAHIHAIIHTCTDNAALHSGKKAQLMERLARAIEAEHDDEWTEKRNAALAELEAVIGSRTNMSKSELRKELAARDLPTDGKKNELIRRFAAALEVEKEGVEKQLGQGFKKPSKRTEQNKASGDDDITSQMTAVERMKAESLAAKKKELQAKLDERKRKKRQKKAGTSDNAIDLDKVWADLDAEEQDAANMVGWTQESWDSCDLGPTEPPWEHLDEAMQVAAALLGFSEAGWLADGLDFATRRKIGGIKKRQHKYRHKSTKEPVLRQALRKAKLNESGTRDEMIERLCVALEDDMILLRSAARDATDEWDGDYPLDEETTSAVAMLQKTKDRVRKKMPKSRVAAELKKRGVKPTSSEEAKAQLLELLNAEIRTLKHEYAEAERSKPARDKDWAFMSVRERVATTSLGWTEHTWNEGDTAPMQKSWVTLTDDQIDSAILLGFFADVWAGNSFDFDDNFDTIMENEIAAIKQKGAKRLKKLLKTAEGLPMSKVVEELETWNAQASQIAGYGLLPTVGSKSKLRQHLLDSIKLDHKKDLERKIQMVRDEARRAHAEYDKSRREAELSDERQKVVLRLQDQHYEYAKLDKHHLRKQLRKRKVKYNSSMNKTTLLKLLADALEREAQVGLDVSAESAEQLEQRIQEEEEMKVINEEKEKAARLLAQQKSKYADMSKTQLINQLALRGLDTSGKKPELQRRMAAHLESQHAQKLADEGFQQARRQAQSLLEQAMPGIKVLTKAELRDELENRGLDSSGAKTKLILRFAEALNEESLDVATLQKLKGDQERSDDVFAKQEAEVFALSQKQLEDRLLVRGLPVDTTKQACQEALLEAITEDKRVEDMERLSNITAIEDKYEQRKEHRLFSQLGKKERKQQARSAEEAKAQARQHEAILRVEKEKKEWAAYETKLTTIPDYRNLPIKDVKTELERRRLSSSAKTDLELRRRLGVACESEKQAISKPKMPRRMLPLRGRHPAELEDEELATECTKRDISTVKNTKTGSVLLSRKQLLQLLQPMVQHEVIGLRLTSESPGDLTDDELRSELSWRGINVKSSTDTSKLVGLLEKELKKESKKLQQQQMQNMSRKRRQVEQKLQEIDKQADTDREQVLGEIQMVEMLSGSTTTKAHRWAKQERVRDKQRQKLLKQQAKMDQREAAADRRKDARRELNNREEMNRMIRLAKILNERQSEMVEERAAALEKQREADEMRRIAKERPGWRMLRTLLIELDAKSADDTALVTEEQRRHEERQQAIQQAQLERTQAAERIMKEGIDKVELLVKRQLHAMDEELHYILESVLKDVKHFVAGHIDRILYFAEKKQLLFQHAYHNKAEFQTRMMHAKLEGATVGDIRMRSNLQVTVLNEYLIKLGQLERIYMPKIIREGDVFLSRSNMGAYIFLEYWKAHARQASEIYNTLVQVDTLATKAALVFPDAYIDEFRGYITRQCEECNRVLGAHSQNSDDLIDGPRELVHPFDGIPGFGAAEPLLEENTPTCPEYPKAFWTSMFLGCDRIVRKAHDMSESANGNDMAIWVEKQHPRDLKKWSRRYLMCKPGYLEYFDTDKNIRIMRKKPKGAIPLIFVTSIQHSPQHHGFVIKTRRRTFVFRAPSHAENEECIYNVECAKRWADAHEDEIQEHQLSIDAWMTEDRATGKQTKDILKVLSR